MTIKAILLTRDDKSLKRVINDLAKQNQGNHICTFVILSWANKRRNLLQ